MFTVIQCQGGVKWHKDSRHCSIYRKSNKSGNQDIIILLYWHIILMYGCESWTIKKAECQRIDAFELWCWRRLLNLLDCKEIQPVNPKGNQSWLFIGRTEAEADVPILWPPDVKNWLIGKDPDAGRDWGQEEKGTAEDEMAGWHHWLDGHEFEWIPGVGDGQGGLACCNSWGCKESDTTEWLNWTELIVDLQCCVNFRCTATWFSYT